MSQVAIRLIVLSVAWSDYGYFYSSWLGCHIYVRGYPFTHQRERGTVRVKCFAQEQNIVYRARTRTRLLDLQAKFVRNLGDLGVTLDSKKVKFGRIFC